MASEKKIFLFEEKPDLSRSAHFVLLVLRKQAPIVYFHKVPPQSRTLIHKYHFFFCFFGLFQPLTRPDYILASQKNKHSTYHTHTSLLLWHKAFVLDAIISFCANKYPCLTWLSIRLWRWHDNRKSLPGCSQGVQCGRPVPEAPNRVRLGVHQAHRQVRPVQPAKVQQGSAQVLRPRPRRLHARVALLPLYGHGVRRATAADHRARLLLRRSRQAQLHHTDEDLQYRLCVQVSSEDWKSAIQSHLFQSRPLSRRVIKVISHAAVVSYGNYCILSGYYYFQFSFLPINPLRFSSNTRSAEPVLRFFFF